MTRRSSIKRHAFAVVATVFLTALCAVATSAAFGQEKSAEELSTLLHSRIGAEWEIPSTLPERVIACEQRGRKVMIFRTGADWNDPDALVWYWDPAESLSEEQAKWFTHVDECKPTLGGTAILVNASAGGAAMVRLEDKKVLFLGRPGGNTHSIARLPDGNFVTASSTGAYLALFAATEPEEDAPVVETPIARKYELKGAHGVVWDAKRRLLWAHGDDELVGYEYVGTKESPELKDVVRVKLTGAQRNGHDLYPAPGYDALVTTGVGINVFDPEKRAFVPDSIAIRGIKSASVSPEGATLVQRAEEEWWSDSIYFGDAKNTRVGRLDGARFYKARWFVVNTFSEP